jgi:ribosomal protein S13
MISQRKIQKLNKIEQQIADLHQEIESLEAKADKIRSKLKHEQVENLEDAIQRPSIKWGELKTLERELRDEFSEKIEDLKTRLQKFLP